MSDPRVRRQITFEAARMMYEGDVKEYLTAKRKAARRLRIDPKPRDLPSNAEIREAILSFAALREGEGRHDRLFDMRVSALALMRRLAAFTPRLIGSVLTGHIRRGSDIDIHVFSPGVGAISTILDDLGMYHTVERKRIVKHGEERVFTHVHIAGEVPIELTVYHPDMIGFNFKSSITGKPIEKAGIRLLEALIRDVTPGVDLEAEVALRQPEIDRIDTLRLLLLPLADAKQSPRYHPEGDALYHSLQVYDHARRACPWDVELLLAALLHDVGKAIDRHDHVAAGVAALVGLVTERTLFLVSHHMDAHALAAGKLGRRRAEALRASPHHEDLVQLSRWDRAGRVPGAPVPDLDVVLEELRQLQAELDAWNATGP